MKAWMLVVLLLFVVGCGGTVKDGFLEIDWPIKDGWLAKYGDSPASQLHYNFWLLGQFAKQQELRNADQAKLNLRYIEAFNAVDPNLMADPNE